MRGATDPAGAIRDFGRALRLDPELAPAYYSRGVAHQALGNRSGAIADFERALALGLSEAQAADARRRLASLRSAR